VPTNEGVLKDLRITLRSSRQNWRLITFRSPRGHLVEFLTNEFKLEPGVIAFLYSRRWEEEKCFDTWKNDFSLAKAWGASLAAIENQVRLAIVTSLLVALLLHRRMGPARNRGRESVAQAGPAPDLRDRRDRSPRLEHPRYSATPRR
jgi:IS4 transposase